MRQDVSPREAVAMLERDSLLLDVREDDEWKAGHAPQAIHVPMSQMNKRASELPTDQTIICICHVGSRSAVVSEALNRSGWRAINLAGGMEAWAHAGLPVVTDDEAEGSVY
jgi:rhodanese-related sulfurtransferase